MKILVVGHTGTIGKAVVEALKDYGHQVVTASRNSGDARVDMTDDESVKAMYRTIGKIDAVVIASGSVPFKPIKQLSEADFLTGFQGKGLGQIRLVIQGLRYISEGGSFTLISGILHDEPVPQAAVASTVNGAVEAFVMASAAELGDGIRINAISPTIVTESLKSNGALFPGFRSVDASDVAQAYVKSVMGIQSGKVFKV